MQKQSTFFISGLISFSFYILVCLLFIYYVSSPKVKTYTVKSKSTVIELDMIVIKSDKKRIEKKEEKKVEKLKDIFLKKETSVSNKKTGNIKSLFGNVKTKSVKISKTNVNNRKISLNSKKYKAKYEKVKKSSNIKLDTLLNNKRTTTNTNSTNTNKNKEIDEYFSKVDSLLSVWTPTVRVDGLVSTILIYINKNGKFDYKFLNYSGNLTFDSSLKEFLEEQKNIIYPIPKNNKVVQISVDFKSEG
jgi:hypothetical protein